MKPTRWLIISSSINTIIYEHRISNNLLPYSFKHIFLFELNKLLSVNSFNQNNENINFSNNLSSHISDEELQISEEDEEKLKEELVKIQKSIDEIME